MRHFILLIIACISIVFFACNRGKNKIPKSKKQANATLDPKDEFYNKQSKKEEKEHLKKAATRKKELEETQPKELNQDYEVPKNPQGPAPKTHY
jgi:outer membrane protein assembly factor BamD (BamD/ComL family)